MTFVIITAGIDLSVGSVLVFAGVMAAEAMEAVGGNSWGTILAGLGAALASGFAWGVLNGFLIAKAKIPALIVTLGTLGMALGAALLITGGVDKRDVPFKLVETDRDGAPVRGDPVPRDHRVRRRAGRRDRARRDALRPLHVRDRLERGGRAARRRRRRPPPDQGLRARRARCPASPASCRWRASRRRRSAATRPTTCRRSPRSSSAARACSAASARCSAPSSASSSRPSSRTAS